MSGSTADAALRAAAGAALIVASVLPYSRTWLEATLVGHVLVQLPLLALSGWLFGAAFSPQFDKIMGTWNQYGVPGLMLVIFTTAFWMLPRSVDSALQYTGYEVLKFLSLPTAGAALASSFPRTHPLLGGVLKANLISMLGVLAWVYTAAPVRLCNSYLGSDQKMLGTGMAVLAGVLSISWGVALLFGATGHRAST